MEASAQFQRSWPDGLLPELKGQLPLRLLPFAAQCRGIETGRTFTLVPALLEDGAWDEAVVRRSKL
jgi:hypothetical protein